MAYTKQSWENAPSINTPINATRLGHIEDGVYNNQNMEILDATDTAPTTFSDGDKYFNTTNNKIYVANNNAWEVLENAVRGIIYIVPSKQKTFYFTGTELISVGGGGGDSTPIGTIVGWGDTTPPENYLELNGQAVSRTTYSELFSLWGTKFGTGDGSTTFNLPDYRDRVPVGLDANDTDFNTIGKKGGEKTHKLTADEIPPLNIYSAGDTSTGNIAYLTNYDGYTGGNIGSIPIGITKLGDNQAHNNLQPYIIQMYIVKASNGSTIPQETAEVVNTYSTSNKNAYSCNYVNDNFQKKEQYSTNEVDTGKIWKNGKHIYKRTIEGVTPSVEGSWQTIADLTGVEYLTDMPRGTLDGAIPIPQYVIPSYYVAIQKAGNDLQLYVMGYTHVVFYITIEYTKTTD